MSVRSGDSRFVRKIKWMCLGLLQTCCFASVLVAIYTTVISMCVALFFFFFFFRCRCRILLLLVWHFHFPLLHTLVRSLVRSVGRFVHLLYRMVPCINVYEQMQGIQFRRFSGLYWTRSFTCLIFCFVQWTTHTECILHYKQCIYIHIETFALEDMDGKCSIVCAASVVWVVRLLFFFLYRFQSIEIT